MESFSSKFGTQFTATHALEVVASVESAADGGRVNPFDTIEVIRHASLT
jgi:hypothetical protein